MKKVLLVLCISAAFYACGGSSSKTGSADSTEAANQSAKAQQSSADTNATKTGANDNGVAVAPGAKLINGSDCATCHKIDSKVIGPAFQDVAAKYPNTDANVDSLATKIIKGGSGHWGNIAMTPHSTMSMDDAKTIAKYILSLKK